MTETKAIPKPSMMFVRVAAATQRARLAETEPGQERYTNWWVAKVLDAIEAEGYVVCRKWDIDKAKAALGRAECEQFNSGRGR